MPPTYDYECQACHHAFERYQSMSARKLRTCPECGKPKLIRLVGAGAGVIFKGSGFYETDYKRAAAKKGGETPKSDASSSDATSSTSTESAKKTPKNGEKKA